MAEQAAAGARLLVNLNASPYSRGRRDERLAVLADRVAETGLRHRLREPGRRPGRAGLRRRVPGHGRPTATVLGLGRPVRRGGAASSTSRCDGPGGRRGPGGPARTVQRRAAGRRRPARLARRSAHAARPEAEVYEALVLGTRDYVAKNGFTDAVIGLSGGIDSSLVAAVAVDAARGRRTCTG